jgi:hypothetical protein
MDATRLALSSIPGAKIMRAVSVLICFHFCCGGVPPKICALASAEVKSNEAINNSFRMAVDFFESYVVMNDFVTFKVSKNQTA